MTTIGTEEDESCREKGFLDNVGGDDRGSEVEESVLPQGILVPVGEEY